MKFLTNNWHQFRLILADFYRLMPHFLWYQLLVKLLFSLIMIPLFFATVNFALQANGNHFVTNNDVLKFLITPTGILLVIIAIAIVLIGASLEICGATLISARHLQHQAPANFRQVFLSSLTLLPKMFGFGAVGIIFYLVFFSPLIGSNFGLSFLNWLKIPNFVTDVIFRTPIYLVGYLMVITATIIFSLLWIFSFHFLALTQQKISTAIRSSQQLVIVNFKSFLKAFFGFGLCWLLVVFCIIIIWSLFVSFLIIKLNLEARLPQQVVVFLLLLQQAIIIVATTLFVPLGIFFLTKLFLQFYQQSITVPKIKTQSTIFDLAFKRPVMRRKLIILSFIVLIILSNLPLSFFVKRPNQAMIISHRAGGFLAAENSLPGLQKSIDTGIHWAEIDVQRTKDGNYIVHHDRNFKRLARNSHSAQELTTTEIKQLSIYDRQAQDHKPTNIATLEEMLKLAQNRISLLIELKGISADRQMVDDLIKLARQYNMLDQVILISMKSDLIHYAETHYQNVTTGLIYYLALGDTKTFNTDYLIVEEMLADRNFIDKAHQSNKRVIVWTVNDDIIAEKYFSLTADGVITDKPDSILHLTQNLSLQDLIINAFGF